MSQNIVLVHTLASLINQFNSLGASILPGVKLFHILDEVILEHIHQHGTPEADDKERLLSHIRSSEEIHASAILVTCSMLSVCIDELRPIVSIPIIKIDEALVQDAVAAGTRIGMLATNPDTLTPSTQIIYDEATRIGKTITVMPVLVENAFSAIRKGDVETHDRLVKQAIIETSPKVDVIVLAQASMARILSILPEHEHTVPVLSSPHLALGQVKEALIHTVK